MNTVFHSFLYNKYCSLQSVAMATFFGEVVTGSYRYIDPDHPDYNDLRAAPQSWSLEPEEVKKEDNLLIITEGDIAGSYVRLLADEQLDTVARVISSGGAELEVRRCHTWTHVSCSGLESGNIGRVLLSLAATETCRVLVLASRHVSQLRCEEESRGVHCLATKGWGDTPLPCPALPQPNIVSGNCPY